MGVWAVFRYGSRRYALWLLLHNIAGRTHGQSERNGPEIELSRWTGAVAKLIQLYGFLDSKRLLEEGKEAGFSKG
jgi:hypothetical protein